MAEAERHSLSEGEGEEAEGGDEEATPGQQERADAIREAAVKAAGNQVEGELYPGKCKWFSLSKCYGFITPDDGTGDVFVHQRVIKMTGYRSLETNEEVEYRFQFSDKGREATVVTGKDGADCKGSKRRLRSKFRRTANRCFNCGQSGHHAKDCPQPPLPKRCYACQSEDHLWADCPQKVATQGNGDTADFGNGSGSGEGNGATGGDQMSPSESQDTPASSSRFNGAEKESGHGDGGGDKT